MNFSGYSRKTRHSEKKAPLVCVGRSQGWLFGVGLEFKGGTSAVDPEPDPSDPGIHRDP